jgi:hypothetical protein
MQNLVEPFNLEKYIRDSFSSHPTQPTHSSNISNSSDDILHEEEETAQLIDNTNKLLADIGIAKRKIQSKEELIRVAPSLVVAVFEALYHVRIDGIIRNPLSQKDYESNAQYVIDSLSEQINIDLTHITGKAIVEGDLQALANLVFIFKRIVALTTSRESLSTIESDSEDDKREVNPVNRQVSDSISVIIRLFPDSYTIFFTLTTIYCIDIDKGVTLRRRTRRFNVNPEEVGLGAETTKTPVSSLTSKSSLTRCSNCSCGTNDLRFLFTTIITKDRKAI